jgi:hypothetical protein
MSTPQSKPEPHFLPPAGIALASPAVNIADLNPVLHSFLIKAGLVNLHLFDRMLVVTSGMDGVHSPGSKHGKGDALDLRIADVPISQQAVFILYLRDLCHTFRLAFFDESNLPGEPHIHVEIAR